MLKNLPASLKKTSLNLRSELLLAFQELGIKADLVKTHVMFTTDCGANIVKALSLYKWVGCACHQLATVLRHVFAVTREEQSFMDILLQTEEDDEEGIFQRQPDVDGVENQLETVAQVNKQLEVMSKVAYLKRSGLNGELTKAVYQENDTRWNSRLNYLRSVIRQMDEVMAVLTRAGKSSLLEDIDADLLAEVAGFLEPFEKATKDMEADHVPTLHKAVLWFYKLQKILSASTGSPISRGVNVRALRFLKQFTFGIFHKVAIFLCPMFKQLSEGMRPDVMSTVRQLIADFPDPVSSADSQPMQDSNF